MVLMVLVNCVFLLCVFTFRVSCCDVHYNFHIDTMFGLSLPPVVYREVHYLRYLNLFAHSGVQNILCCRFVLFFFVLLPVSLDCPFLMAPSVFLTFIENH